jgi:hypothetical protein
MRRFVIIPAAIIVLLASAIPALAAPPPRIHENGTVAYASATIEDCTRNGCTYTSVSGQIEQGSGDTFICFDQGTRQGYTFGCTQVDPSAVTITESGATIALTTISVEQCGRRGCTVTEVEVSADIVVVGEYEPYSFSSRNKFGDCTERFQVRGENAESTATFTVDGDEFTADFATVGQETYNFSTTCPVFE